MHLALVIFKAMQCFFSWPKLFKHACNYFSCFKCQDAMRIKKNDHLPLIPIIEIQMFNGVLFSWVYFQNMVDMNTF